MLAEEGDAVARYFTVLAERVTIGAAIAIFALAIVPRPATTVRVPVPMVVPVATAISPPCVELAPAPPPPATTTVAADRVCTGTRCDPVGPHLATAIRRGEDLAATSDHAAVVVGKTLWNRVRDHEVALGDDQDIVAVQVLGNRVMASRSCDEWCSEQAELLDANGRIQGPTFPSKPNWDHGPGPGFVAVGDDRFLVLGMMGEVTLIAGGKAVVLASVLATHASHPREVHFEVKPAAPGVVAYRWCDLAGCHIGSFHVETDGPPGLVIFEERVLPECTRPAPVR